MACGTKRFPLPPFHKKNNSLLKQNIKLVDFTFFGNYRVWYPPQKKISKFAKKLIVGLSPSYYPLHVRRFVFKILLSVLLSLYLPSFPTKH